MSASRFNLPITKSRCACACVCVCVCEREFGLERAAPFVNFINVLRTAFALVDPESVKNTVKS